MPEGKNLPELPRAGTEPEIREKPGRFRPRAFDPNRCNFCLFLSVSANEFPSSFESLVRKILRLLFHVLAHLYHCHFREVVLLNLHAQLNCVFAHLTLFNHTFQLIEPKETEILQDLVVALKIHSDSVSIAFGTVRRPDRKTFRPRLPRHEATPSGQATAKKSLSPHLGHRVRGPGTASVFLSGLVLVDGGNESGREAKRNRAPAVNEGRNVPERKTERSMPNKASCALRNCDFCCEAPNERSRDRGGIRGSRDGVGRSEICRFVRHYRCARQGSSRTLANGRVAFLQQRVTFTETGTR